MNKFYRTTMKLFLVAIILGIGVRLAAQDLLVFTDGSIEQVKVLEVGDDAIKYKKWANLDGPTFSTSKANVFSIKYQDGSEEKMVNQQVRPAPNQPYQPRQNTGGGGYQQTLDGGFSIYNRKNELSKKSKRLVHFFHAHTAYLPAFLTLSSAILT